MEFDYYSENYREFEKAFHKHWVGEIPLTYLTDDLLKAMKPHRPYFQMPPQQCVDSKRKWFVFEVDGEKYNFVVIFNCACYCIVSYTNLLLRFGLCYLPVYFRECSS